MIRLVTDYFARLADAFGQGWTRFWFTPSDPTTLSAIRLCTGLVVVYLHATLSFDLIALFGPSGLLPAADIAPLDGPTFSYLNFLSQPGELWAIHMTGLAVLILFAIGYWTRLTTILALIVFLSDINRAPMITSLTEPIAAMVMLYLCLAPCGRNYSLDALLSRRGRQAALNPDDSASRPSTMATIATRLIQIHLTLLVAMMGFSKLSSEVWWIGTGMWWLMARPESRLVDVTWLYKSPKLIDAWTHVVVLFELGFPLLIWIPLARPLLLGIGVFVWASIAMVTGDITFALMMGIASMAFISPATLQACCRRTEPAAAIAA
jgi:hypothetical protein